MGEGGEGNRKWTVVMPQCSEMAFLFPTLFLDRFHLDVIKGGLLEGASEREIQRLFI